MVTQHPPVLLLAFAIMLTGGHEACAAPTSMPDAPGYYTTPATMPDATRYLPPPPVAGSARQAADNQAFQATRHDRGDARWALATADANLQTGALLHAFSCAAGFTINSTEAPRLTALIHRMDASEIPDMRNSKQYWHRARPFVGNSQPICTEDDRAHLGQSGSYPSGHTMLGWSTALLLTELLPDRATPLLQRGRVFGESRIVCGAHWASDVQEGYLVAAGQIAAMHASPEFQTDIRAARAELDGLRKTAPQPDPQICAMEQDAATHSPL